MRAKIILLPGDGIGPEVVAEGRKVLEAVAKIFGHTFDFEEHLIGGRAIDEAQNPLPEATLTACRAANGVLLGAVGGPKWDNPNADVFPEQGLLRLRRDLELFANLRPIKPYHFLSDASPLRAEKLEAVDILIVRELTGGIYFGEPRLRDEINGQVRAIDTMVYTSDEIYRIIRLAFELAGERRGKVTSVDKANVLETSRLWRQLAIQVAAEYPHVELEHQLVDSASMRLITSASEFDVLVTANLFGDILTDEASVLAGSLGVLPSASLGIEPLGVYEPIHGSAPDIAGKNIANPIGTILSAAMLLRHSLHLEVEASSVEGAIEGALNSGARTVDLDDSVSVSTSEFGDVICEHINQL